MCKTNHTLCKTHENTAKISNLKPLNDRVLCEHNQTFWCSNPMCSWTKYFFFEDFVNLTSTRISPKTATTLKSSVVGSLISAASSSFNSPHLSSCPSSSQFPKKAHSSQFSQFCRWCIELLLTATTRSSSARCWPDSDELLGSRESVGANHPFIAYKYKNTNTKIQEDKYSNELLGSQDPPTPPLKSHTSRKPLYFISFGYIYLKAEILRSAVKDRNEIFGIYFRLLAGLQDVRLPPSPQWAGFPPMASRPGGWRTRPAGPTAF